MQLKYSRELEAEAIEILREVRANFSKPVLLFSGGKDSLTLIRLLQEAVYPSAFPMPLLHIDTGHNFTETLKFRDWLAKEVGAELIVRKVEDSIRDGLVEDETGPYASRNRIQSATLMAAIREFGFDALIGGARRDEEKARAKERIFSHRNAFGEWIPREQRPELWAHYNTLINPGEHMRVFPLSNWTELDVWHYIAEQKLEVPEIYFAHERECVRVQGHAVVANSAFIHPQIGDTVERLRVRFRTVGDMTCTGAFPSQARSIDEIIEEITVSRLSERGTRLDDQRSESAMEDRKKEGYF